MDILIVGNGFDLAHNLKTSYKDFLNYCLQNSNDESLKNLCETNLWMKHFITRQKELGDTWIDLENEIYNVILYITRPSSQLSKQVLTFDKYSQDFNLLKLYDNLRPPYFGEETIKDGYSTFSRNNLFNYFFENLEDLKCLLYKQLREFTKTFEIYLINNTKLKENEIAQFNLQLNSDKNQPQGKTLYVLSFNYTNTCERLYNQKKNQRYGYQIKTYYIHGQAKSDNNCYLVLGTHSFDNKRTASNSQPIPVDFNIFKKHNQRHKYGTIEDYQELLKIINNSLQMSLVFHVIGHSLNKTDHKVLKHILLANKNAKINIYYHNEEAQEQLINNITEIIGEEEVMTRVRFIYQHDKKLGILLEKIIN